MQRFRGYDQNGMTEPRYGGVVGYSAFSESYATKSEQVVEYGGLGGKPYKDGKIHQLLQPTWNSSPHEYESPKKGDKLVRPGSAWNNIPPSKNHQSGKYNNFSSDESDDDEYYRDDVVCDENGYCYPKPPKHAEEYDHDHAPNYDYNNMATHKNYKSKPTSTPSPHESYYEKPKPNPNDYTTPHPQPYYEKRPNSSGNHDYTTHSPKSYYEATPKPNGNHDYSTTHPPQSYYEASPKPNGNGYTTPPPQQYYEAVPNNKAMVHKPLPSVKTRLDRPNKGIGMESQMENMRINSPKSPYTSSPSPRSPYKPSPRKDQGYHDTIDSVEARRRYGGATVSAPVELYKGTIDSQEAAKRYAGIFLNY